MTSCIIYTNETSGLSIIFPILESGLSLGDIAKKDVPAGIPYKIINVEDIPSDRTFRSAWEADFTEPDGYGLGYDAWFDSRQGE